MSSDAGSGAIETPIQSPLFHAANANRYDRQSLIGEYEDAVNCRLVVMIDEIFDYSITLFEDLIYDANPDQDLHLMISSPGGDGEAAVRLVRSIQARCKELTVIVPSQAKSAATLLALGAHHIIMAPASDLGPVDPQFRIGSELVAAKDIIATVDHATAQVQAAPSTYPIHASLLGDLTAIMVQQARSAMNRSQDLLTEALRSNPDRNEETVEQLRNSLTEPLIERPQSHAALFSADHALETGLPVQKAELAGERWKLLWRLWTKYFGLGNQVIYEGRRSSQVHNRPDRPEARVG